MTATYYGATQSFSVRGKDVTLNNGKPVPSALPEDNPIFQGLVAMGAIKVEKTPAKAKSRATAANKDEGASQ